MNAYVSKGPPFPFTARPGKMMVPTVLLDEHAKMKTDEFRAMMHGRWVEIDGHPVVCFGALTYSRMYVAKGDPIGLLISDEDAQVLAAAETQGEPVLRDIPYEHARMIVCERCRQVEKRDGRGALFAPCTQCGSKSMHVHTSKALTVVRDAESA